VIRFGMYDQIVVVPERKVYWRSGIETFGAHTVGSARGRVVRSGYTPFAEERDPIPPITVVGRGRDNDKLRTTVDGDGYWHLPDVVYGKPITFRRPFSTFDPKTVVARPMSAVTHLRFIDEILFALIVALNGTVIVLIVVVILDKAGVINV
jgi:hypothetical protein